MSSPTTLPTHSKVPPDLLMVLSQPSTMSSGLISDTRTPTTLCQRPRTPLEHSRSPDPWRWAVSPSCTCSPISPTSLLYLETSWLVRDGSSPPPSSEMSWAKRQNGRSVCLSLYRLSETSFPSSSRRVVSSRSSVERAFYLSRASLPVTSPLVRHSPVSSLTGSSL